MKLRDKLIKSRVVYILALLAFGFLAWRIVKDWKVVSGFSWQFNLLNLMISIALSFLAYFLNIYSWHVLTKALNLKISLRDNFKIWIYSNLTRFLPGKIWQFPSRILLLSERKVEEVVSGAATLIEVLLNFSSAALVVYVSFMFWRFPKELNKYYPFLTLFVVAPIIISFLFNKKSIIFFAGLLKKITKKEIGGLGNIKLPYYLVLPLVLLFTFRFVVIAGVLMFLTKAFFQISVTNYVIFLGAGSLSWLLGYISFFAPAGLGVTEVTLASLLSSVVPFAIASIIAVFYRFTVLITEAIFLGIQLLFFRRKSSAI